MDSFELNKVLGAILFTVLVVLSLRIVSEAIYTPGEPEQPGYAIAALEPGHGDGADGGTEEVAEVSIAALLQDADAERGAQAAKKCQACHTFEQGGPARVGPNLWDVVGRPIAEAAGFNYSGAMMEMKGGETWSFEKLNAFLTNPKTAVPGTAMAFAGLSRDQERADVIAYLRSLSDSPVALPEPPAAMEEPSEAAAMEEPSEAAAMEEPSEAAMAEEPAADMAEEPAADMAAEEPAGDMDAGAADAQSETDMADAATDDAAGAGGDTAMSDIAQRLQTADVERGVAATKICQACHTFDEGGGKRVGPNLWGIVGSQVARAEDFKYSDALKAQASETWTFEKLDEFLTNPREAVPGTAMVLAVSDADKRADVIAFLRSLSNDPVALPAAQ